MSSSNEQLDEAGNPIRVADLTFVDGILGTGAYGTVYLARRHPTTGCASDVATDQASAMSISTSNTNNTPPEFSPTPQQQQPAFLTPQSVPRALLRRVGSAGLPGLPPPTTPMTPATPTTTATTTTTSTSSSTEPQARYIPRARRGEGGGGGGGMFSMARSNSAPAGDDFFRMDSGSFAQSPIVQKAHTKFNSIFRSDSMQNNNTTSQQQYNNTNNNGHFHLHPRQAPLRRSWSRKGSGNSSDGGDTVEGGAAPEGSHLVAVKIFRKSVLKRKRTMERDKETRKMLVKTALEKVEREIALMKKLAHPNLVEFYEAIDSPDSDVLYLVSRRHLYIYNDAV